MVHSSLKARPTPLWWAAALITTAVSAGTTANPTAADPDAQAAQAVSQMTLEEKAAQMLNAAPGIARLGLTAYDYWSEALHGYVSPHRPTTAYPEPIGLAASFNPVLIQAMGAQIAREGRAVHDAAAAQGGGATGMFAGATFFAPNLNLFRDPRWGRGQETYGEDPYLIGRLGVAFIQGVQSQGLATATAKHLAVHSGPEPVRHHFNAKVSAHDLHDTYLPAFRDAVIDGQVASVMCVYNAINGVPGCAHGELLNGIVRGDWGFKGFVVSDCDAVRDIHKNHKAVPSEAHAVAAAVKNGTDLECYFGPPTASSAYVDAVKQGLLSQAELDRALTRTLRSRYQIGVLGAPRPAAVSPMVIESEAHRATALQAARESLVLLKNNGVLPLRGKAPRIAVVGPLADHRDSLLGNYNALPSRVVTPLAGLRARYGDQQVGWVRGADFPVTPVPVPAALLTTDDGQPGLRVEVFAGEHAQGAPVASHVHPELRWNNVPGQGLVRFSGYLTPAVSGEVDLVGYGTGGVRYYIDDQLVVDDTTPHQPLDTAGKVRLEQGKRVKLRAEFVPFPFGFNHLMWFQPDPQGIDKARALARDADVVVAVVGINSKLEGEEMKVDHPGFKGGDRTSLDLPAEEQQLLEAMKATGKPLVVVLMSGSALAVNWAQQHADAIVHAWYGGQEAGTAIADVLSGDFNPAGRLPVTFYTGVDQLPAFEDYAMQQRTYRYFTGKPLYPFGYGLSYTRFAYGPVTLNTARVVAGRPLQAKVTVRNTGQRAGDEVVQAYLRFPSGTPGAPRLALRGFARVHLKPGESQAVTLRFAPRDLSHVQPDGRRVVGAAGDYVLAVGGGQPQTQAPGASRTFRITGRTMLPN